MTIYGWDASHHDWGRGPMDVAAAVRDGISFMTHKIGEGSSYTDDRFDDWYARARAAKVPLLGAYYVNHRGDQNAQADRFLTLLDAKAPGWRDGPFMLQADCERWSNSSGVYAYEPRPAEVKAFCDRLVAKTHGRYRPLAYAPKWVYGDTLKGLPYPLWASAYGSNPAVRYRSAYPGDGSSRWAAYSGQTPAILQYGSKLIIGTQSTCDANAYRGTLDQLRALVYPGGEDHDMDTTTPLYRNGPTLPVAIGDLHYAEFRGNLVSVVQRALAAAKLREEAILAAVKGLDTTAVLARIDEVAQADAERDADLRALVQQAASGERDAAEVVRLIGERLATGATAQG